MKKTKILIFTALAVSATMISSCSDNDVLETQGEKTTGTPLVINASVDGSRATELTQSNFTGFKLYAFQNNTNKTSLFGAGVGLDYEGEIGGAWSVPVADADKAKWPEDKSVSCNFYGISVQGGSDITTDNIDVSQIANGVFMYQTPSAMSFTGDEATQKDIMVATQVELLNSDESATGKKGVVDLNFSHALANVTLQFRFNSEEWSTVKNKLTSTGNIPDGTKYAIDYIKICNIKTKGQYSFYTTEGDNVSNEGTWSTTGEWVTSGDPTSITITFPNKLILTARQDATASTPVTYTDVLVGNQSLMIIPQTPSYWDTTLSKHGDETYERTDVPVTDTDGAYIEIHGVMWDVTQSYTTQAVTYGSLTPEQKAAYDKAQLEEDPDYEAPGDDEEVDIKVPIEGTPFDYTDINTLSGFTNIIEDGNNTSNGYSVSVYSALPQGFKFEKNKKYNLRINLYNVRNPDGSLALNEASQS